MIRAERAGDEAAISALITDAFAAAPHSSGTEAKIVEGLRSSGALTISLVAEQEGRTVGHIAFSPVTIAGADRGWYGLGPVAVLPIHQGKGIGSALIVSALHQLRDRHANGCVVLGDPAYYGRFGFQAEPRLTFSTAPAEYFQALRFSDNTTEGEVAYHPAFSAG